MLRCAQSFRMNLIKFKNQIGQFLLYPPFPIISKLGLPLEFMNIIYLIFQFFSYQVHLIMCLINFNILNFVILK